MQGDLVRVLKFCEILKAAALLDQKSDLTMGTERPIINIERALRQAVSPV